MRCFEIFNDDDYEETIIIGKGKDLLPLYKWIMAHTSRYPYYAENCPVIRSDRLYEIYYNRDDDFIQWHRFDGEYPTSSPYETVVEFPIESEFNRKDYQIRRDVVVRHRNKYKFQDLY